MTTPPASSSIQRSPLDSFQRAVAAGIPPHSRRDLVRAAAIIAAAAGSSGDMRPVVAGTGNQVDLTRSVAQDGDGATAAELPLPLYPFGQPVTLDPHRTVNWGPFWVLLPHVWAGPLRFDENGAVQPALAETVEPNDDATVWRLTLRPDLAFASGRTIAAEDCIASWKRALDPGAVSPMAAFMSNVDGFDAYTSGESTEIGLTVIDDRTIEIRLAAPDSSFPASLATFVWAVIDLDVLDDSDVDDSLLADAGAGAWRFTEFVEGERLVMEPNPEYWGGPPASVQRVVWRILDGADAVTRALDLYQSDDLAIADVPISMLGTVREDDALSRELVTIDTHASTMAIGLDFNQAPFDNVQVRRALAAAIDNDVWASEIWEGAFVPADSFVPPVVSVISDYTPAATDFGPPDSATDLLAQAGIDPLADLPEIVYFQPATDASDDIKRQGRLLQMIEDNSGIVIRHDTTLTHEQIEARQRDNGGHQFDIVWWWTVSDTAKILDTAANPDSPAMRGRFNWSPELESIGEEDPAAAASRYRELIMEANASVDPDARNEAFRQAEQLLLDNAVYIPLGHWVQRFVQKPWLQGTRQGAWSGSLPVEIDADVVIQGRDD